MSSLSLLKAKQPNFLSLSAWERWSISDHFWGPPLHPLQQVHAFPILRTPELDPGRVSPKWSREEKSPPRHRPLTSWCVAVLPSPQ